MKSNGWYRETPEKERLRLFEVENKPWSVPVTQPTSQITAPPPARLEAPSPSTRVVIVSSEILLPVYSPPVWGLAENFLLKVWGELGSAGESSFFSLDYSDHHGSLSVCLFTQPSCTHPGPPPGHHSVTTGCAPSQQPHVHGCPCFLTQLWIQWRRRLCSVWKFRAAQTARPPSSEHTQLAQPPSQCVCPPSRGTRTQDQFSKPAWNQRPHQWPNWDNRFIFWGARQEEQHRQEWEFR